jgi:hypothetical protein
MSSQDHESNMLFIDSRFADGESNVDFSVIFNKSTQTHASGYPTQVFKNVSSVELTAISIATDCLQDPSENYVVIDVDELNNRVHSNVPQVNQSFATLYIDDQASNLTEKSFKGHDFDVKVKKFDPPLSSLSRLTVKIRNPRTRELVMDRGKTTMMFNIKTLKSSA